MRILVLYIILICSAAAQGIPSTIDSIPRGSDPSVTLRLETLVFIPGPWEGSATITAGDSVSVSIEGVTVNDNAIVSYAHQGPVPQDAEESNIGWAIWQDGVLTLYGQIGSVVSYLILRIR